MTLAATGFNDMVAMTQKDLGKPKFTQIAQTLQKYTAIKNLFKKNRVELQSGYGVQWDVMVNYSTAARNVGMADQDDVNIADTMVQASADWRNTTTSYGFEGREIDMNREPARIVDLVRQRRLSCMIGLAELMETNFWGPPVALTDAVTPWGVNTWIVKNASEGFNGGAPSGYTTIGLNPSTYSAWKNYTAQYVSVTKDDLLRKWRKAANYTDYEPVMEHPDLNTGNDYGFYTNYAARSALIEILESQNENLGTDLAPMDNGGCTFMQTPVEWVPKLDADTTNPIYGINWGEFKTIVLKGWWMKETNIPIYPGQHTVSAHFLDCTYQPVARSRRSHFVIATGVTYPS